MRNTHFSSNINNAQYALRNSHLRRTISVMKTGEKIRQLRLAKKMTLEEVEQRAELSPGNLSRIERGLQWPPEEKLQSIARALNIDIASLFTGAQDESQFNAESEQEIAPGRYVAIVGIAVGGPDGYVSIDDYPPGEGDGRILTHSRDSGAYALRVRGDSMRPRIKSGEYIIAEPSIAPQPADDVVVRLIDGRALVKELLFVTGDDVRLGSVNNDVAPITIPIEQIEYIHRVAAIVPRGSALLKALYSDPNGPTGDDRRKSRIDRRGGAE